MNEQSFLHFVFVFSHASGVAGDGNVSHSPTTFVQTELSHQVLMVWSKILYINLRSPENKT